MAQIHTNWGLMAYPRLCGLLGDKPTRLSQSMHNAAFSSLQLPFSYVAFNITDTEFGLSAMRKLGMRGLSLTIPHKEAALSLIDEIGDEVSKIKAVNTVINLGDSLFGFNTDWFGVLKALQETGFTGEGKTALVFGAGGASRAALFALQQLNLDAIFVANRGEQRAEGLAQEFSVDFIKAEQVQKMLREKIDLFINATPIGRTSAAGSPEYPFSLNSLSKGQVVFDMVTRETPLIQASRANGALTIPGIRMLLYQAVEQFKLFTEQEAPVEVMEQALMEELKKLG